MITIRKLAGMALLTPLLACTVGPDYELPPAPVPSAYKEQDGWKVGTPQPAASDGAWWSVFQDPVLDALERQVAISNQNVLSYEAAYRNGVAAAQAANAGFFPTLTMDASVERAAASTGGTGSTKRSQVIANQFSTSLGASWELDIWGKIRRTVESSSATAQADAADLAAARLSAQATLASDYFSLRAEDELKRLLDATAEAYAISLQIARNQYTAGVAARSDVTQAETQLRSTQAQAINVGIQRAELEHAIAVLVGKAPADFTLPPTEGLASPPAVPVTIPSVLLERRPDIAAAERRMAAANAQIGVAVAAYYPTLGLSASYGFSGTALDQLFRTASNVWSVGPALSGTLFDGGLRSAQVAEARASYDQEVATYRQTVLTGFQQVEDELASLKTLDRQLDVQRQAVQSAEESQRLILNQYKAGTLAYTSVVTAQASALSARQSELTIRQNLLTATVSLIQALGGGWSVEFLPSPTKVLDANP